MPTKTRVRDAMKEFADIVIARRRSETRSPQAISKMRRAIRTLEEVGVRSSRGINDAAVRRYELALPEGTKQAHGNLMSDLRILCEIAVEEHVLEAVPRSLERKQSAHRGAPRANSRDEVKTFLRFARPGIDPPWTDRRRFAFSATLVYTGFLRDDVLNLKTKDVDFAAGTISGCRRTGNAEVPEPFVMHRDLRAILEDWEPHAGREYFFPGVTKVGRWWGSGCKRLRAVEEIRQAGRAAGIENPVNPNTLRRAHFAFIKSGEGFDGLCDAPRRSKTMPRPAVTIGDARNVLVIRGRGMCVAPYVYGPAKILIEEHPRRLSLKELQKRGGSLGGFRRYREKVPRFASAFLMPGEMGPDGNDQGFGVAPW
jgi:integrase